MEDIRPLDFDEDKKWKDYADGAGDVDNHDGDLFFSGNIRKALDQKALEIYINEQNYQNFLDDLNNEEKN